jgi:CheY-like chemotaxis protein
MSHEIRTPLNGVIGMAQAMMADRLSKPQRERLQVISQSGEMLLTVVNDVLDLSKIEAGKLRLEVADFDLEEITTGAETTFGLVAAAKGLEFTVEVAADAAGVYQGDAMRVRQVLYNLVSNAMKFTASGAVAVHIDRLADGLSITVADTGIGIAPEQIERLFDKFVQADSSTTRQYGGSGLGLAICRELCEAMGGDIALESRLGQGSRFTVRLPLARIGDSRAVAPVAVASAEPAADERPMRILAAEDNAVNQLVLRTLLGQFGIDPVIVGNGEEAVTSWEAGDWDLILMDAQMPVMDGITATRQIRSREAASGRRPTPIIALTANAMGHQVEAYRAAGMDAVVAKPIQIAQLLEAITAVAARDAEIAEDPGLDRSPASAQARR